MDLADHLQALGIEVDPHLMDLAFTHRSWAYENGRVATNERLEFLGDSVLGAVITEHIFATYPDRSEGQLAKMRAAVVSGAALARIARDLEIGPRIKLGKGEIITRGDTKDSILADAMEAVIGAIHLSGGSGASGTFIHRVMGGAIADAAGLGAGLDWKSSLQELCTQRGMGIPEYSTLASGPDHQRSFTAEVSVDSNLFGQGQGTSRRAAEQRAAEIAYLALTESAHE